jgi:CheY-like chemotaxis protein
MNNKNRIFIFSTRKINQGFGLFGKVTEKVLDSDSNIFEKKLKYYEITNDTEQDRIIAVHILKDRTNYSTHNKKWIEYLQKSFKKENTEYFFILHDNDLYDYEDVDFGFLNEKDKIENVNGIVFRHTSNDIVKILNESKGERTNKDIANQINGLFHKKPFIEKILKYIDERFEDNKAETLKDEIDNYYNNYKDRLDFNDKELKYIYTNIYLEIDKKIIIPDIKNKLNKYTKILKLSDYVFYGKYNENRKNTSQWVFFQDKYKDLIIKKNQLGTKRNDFTPTIYISLFNFLDDEENSENKNNKEDKINPIKILAPYMPRYKNIMDSSIWNYYVPYYKEKSNFENLTKNKEDLDEVFEERLSEVIDKINTNYENRLYALPKTREYANLMYRLLKESYLEDSGHAASVSPFLFTSESEMEEAADKVLKKIDKKLSWRFLLVDDESYLLKKDIKETELTEKDKVNLNEEEIVRKKSKCQIIKNVLNKDFNFKCNCKCGKDNPACKLIHKTNPYPKSSDKPSIEMVCVKNNKEALKKLQSAEKYDIVLMDYLLGENEDKTRREYSTELLQDVKNVFDFDFDYEVEKKEKEQNKWLEECELIPQSSTKDNKKLLEKLKGICGKFWFFYISAYNRAVHEQLLEKQFLRTTKYWHIEEGACPINTPQLFRYLLFSFMKYQIDTIAQPQEGKDKEGKTIKLITVIDLLNHIFQNINDVRNRAIKNFNNLLELRLTYNKIKYDTYWKYIKKDEKDKKEVKNIQLERDEEKCEKSELIMSLFPDVEYYDNAFWEHTMHLVYLTAFGTIRQWHDMWEEFMLIKPYLQKACDEKDGKETPLNTKAKDVIKYIETYITSLQSQSQ